MCLWRLRLQSDRVLQYAIYPGADTVTGGMGGVWPVVTSDNAIVNGGVPQVRRRAT